MTHATTSSNERLRNVGGVPLFRGRATEPAWFFGWVPRPAEVDAHLMRRPLSFFSEAGAPLAGSGTKKTVLLYEAVRKVWGRDLDPGPQQIGDCVSWGYAGCVDLIACLEVAAGEAETHSWDLRTCTEAVYALSRVEYGNFDGSYEDGSYGGWAAVAVRQGGTLSRARTGGKYHPDRAKAWGATGLPDELEPEAREHTVRRASLVRSWEQARDAIANGYPVAVCSNQAFEQLRDKDGFAMPKGIWYHCMKFIASKDDDRPGLLCMNSWGDWHAGPTGKYEIPAESFWVDAEVVDQMLSQGDSYALSQFNGYPNRIDTMRSLSLTHDE